MKYIIDTDNMTIVPADAQPAPVPTPTPTPVPPPAPTPAPTPVPAGYRVVWNMSVNFPEGRVYTHGMQTNDLTIVSFVAPAGARFLTVECTNTGPSRRINAAISAVPGDFDAAMKVRNSPSPTFQLTTADEPGLVPVNAGQTYYINLRYLESLPSAAADIVIAVHQS